MKKKDIGIIGLVLSFMLTIVAIEIKAIDMVSSIILTIMACVFWALFIFLIFENLDKKNLVKEDAENNGYYIEATTALIVRHKTKGIICETEDEEFSSRIVDCLNACNGMSDPIFEMDNLAYRASFYPNRIALQTKIESQKIHIETMRYLLEMSNNAESNDDFFNARNRISEFLSHNPSYAQKCGRNLLNKHY